MKTVLFLYSMKIIMLTFCIKQKSILFTCKLLTWKFCWRLKINWNKGKCWAWKGKCFSYNQRRTSGRLQSPLVIGCTRQYFVYIRLIWVSRFLLAELNVKRYLLKVPLNHFWFQHCRYAICVFPLYLLCNVQQTGNFDWAFPNNALRSFDNINLLWPLTLDQRVFTQTFPIQFLLLCFS